MINSLFLHVEPFFNIEMKKINFLFAGILLVGCSPKVGTNFTNPYPMLAPDDEVVVLEEHQPAPQDADKIGSIKVGDTGFTLSQNGTYDKVINIIDSYSREVGGNVIKITAHQVPDFFSTIHRVNADLYHIDDIKSLGNSSTLIRTPVQPAYISSGAGDADFVAAQTVAENEPDWKWAISADLGFGRRLGKLSPNLTESEKVLQKGLMNGISYDFKAIYYTNRAMGFGILYHSFYKKNEEYGTITYSNGSSESGTLIQKLNLWYACPVMSFRFISKNGKGVGFVDYGLGVAGYYENDRINSRSGNAKGFDVGYFASAEYDFFLSDHLAAGAFFSLASGSVRNFDYETIDGVKYSVSYEADQAENISGIGVGFSLKWLF